MRQSIFMDFIYRVRIYPAIEISFVPIFIHRTVCLVLYELILIASHNSNYTPIYQNVVKYLVIERVKIKLFFYYDFANILLILYSREEHYLYWVLVYLLTSLLYIHQMKSHYTGILCNTQTLHRKIGIWFFIHPENRENIFRIFYLLLYCRAIYLELVNCKFYIHNGYFHAQICIRKLKVCCYTFYMQ